MTQHEGETLEDSRRRRRQELARGWKFACACDKCLAEKPVAVETETDNQSTVDADYLGITKDESKLEEVVARVEAQLA